MKLHKNTIQSIADFTNEAKENNLVEAVHFLCTQERNVINIDVTVVYNRTNSRSGINLFYNLNELLSKYNENSQLTDNELLIFHLKTSKDYNNFPLYQNERDSFKELIKSYILFDRYGDYEKLKKDYIDMNDIGRKILLEINRAPYNLSIDEEIIKQMLSLINGEARKLK